MTPDYERARLAVEEADNNLWFCIFWGDDEYYRNRLQQYHDRAINALAHAAAAMGYVLAPMMPEQSHVKEGEE